MKSRLPPISSNQLLKIRKEVAKEFDKQGQEISRRILKTVCVALNQNFGFGKDRLLKLLEDITELSKEQEKDIVFWYHIDTVVIEQLGLEFERENYNKMDM